MNCEDPKCLARSKIVEKLKMTVRKATTKGRSSNNDREFLNRLAAICAGVVGVRQDVIADLTGLSAKRIRTMREAPVEPKQKKIRADARTDADKQMLIDWIEETCRRSADKNNGACHVIHNVIAFHLYS